jgi:hypothetical protein
MPYREVLEVIVMQNSLFIRCCAICFFILNALISPGCRGHSDGTEIKSSAAISLKEHEQLYEGFLISGSMWQAFVRDMKDLTRAERQYWVKYDPVVFKEGRLSNEIRRAGEWIDWPSRYSRSRVTWVKFIGEEPEKLLMVGGRYGSRRQVAEFDNELVIKRVVAYSSEPVEAALNEL